MIFSLFRLPTFHGSMGKSAELRFPGSGRAGRPDFARYFVRYRRCLNGTLGNMRKIYYCCSAREREWWVGRRVDKNAELLGKYTAIFHCIRISFASDLPQNSKMKFKLLAQKKLAARLLSTFRSNLQSGSAGVRERFACFTRAARGTEREMKSVRIFSCLQMITDSQNPQLDC